MSEGTRHDECAACGYDLRGLQRRSSARCPECGQGLSEIALVHAREATAFRRLRRQMVWLIVTVGLLGGIAASIATTDAKSLFLLPFVLLVVGPLLPVVLAADFHGRREE